MIGIDVSYHNKQIDWGLVKADGVEFAIIRAGYGKSTVDVMFHENISKCIENDILVGVYWFIYAINEEEAIQNAIKCHETIKAYKDHIKMRVWCDLEYDTDNNAVKRGVTLTKDLRTKMVKAFCEKLKSYGYDVGNYSNPDYLKNKFNDLSEYPLWLAYYVKNEALAKQYNPIIWQHTSKGSVNGIKGNVDLNVYYGFITTLKPTTERYDKRESVSLFQLSANLDHYRDSKNRQLVVDGIVGENTKYVAKKVLLKADKVFLTYKVGSDGFLVEYIQKMCNNIIGSNLVVDGLFGKSTRTAVINLQKKLGVTADGIVGYNTLMKLFEQ